MKLFKGIAGDQKLELEFGRYNDLLKTLKSDESEKVDSKQNGKG